MRLAILSKIIKPLKFFSDIPIACRVGLIIQFFDSTLMAMFYFLSIYFVRDLHLSIAGAASAISFYGIGAIIGGYISGRLCDKKSPLNVSIVSILIQSLAYFLFLKFKSIYFLAFNIYILGIATYSFITSINAWLLLHCRGESQRLKIISLSSTASNLALGLSGIIICSVSKYGFNVIFTLVASLSLLMAGTLFLTKSHFTNDILVPPLLNRAPKLTDRIDNKILLLVLFNVLIIGCIVAQISSTYTLYIQTKFPSLGMQASTILFSINTFMIVIFATPLTSFFSRKNKIVLLGVGGFLIGAGMGILSISSVFFLVIASCIIYTLGEILFFSVAQLLCYQHCPANKKGKSLGIYRVTFASSRMIGPAAGGHLFHYIGGNLIWYISALLGVICLFTCSLLKKHADL